MLRKEPPEDVFGQRNGSGCLLALGAPIDEPLISEHFGNALAPPGVANDPFRRWTTRFAVMHKVSFPALAWYDVTVGPRSKADDETDFIAQA